MTGCRFELRTASFSVDVYGLSQVFA